ncbi:hypothetical protein Fmac_012361 [Flemingia macrophylla]|uniref:Disease resistance protein n=1 Tax=Flemingia macrophylla TaxID=520843 RepID=A0ABD1MQ31_9FABA
MYSKSGKQEEKVKPRERIKNHYSNSPVMTPSSFGLIISFAQTGKRTRLGGLPAPNLTHFCVENCHKLKALPNHMSALLPKLEYLMIENYPEIESFPARGMPPNLRSIEIINCEKLLRDIA